MINLTIMAYWHLITIQELLEKQLHVGFEVGTYFCAGLLNKNVLFIVVWLLKFEPLIVHFYLSFTQVPAGKILA